MILVLLNYNNLDFNFNFNLRFSFINIVKYFLLTVLIWTNKSEQQQQNLNNQAAK